MPTPSSELRALHAHAERQIDRAPEPERLLWLQILTDIDRYVGAEDAPAPAQTEHLFPVPTSEESRA